MNQGIKKLLVTMSFAFCLFGTVFATQAKAEDAAPVYERKVLPYTAQEVSDFLSGTDSYPSQDGYLFAGWYTDEKCDDTCYLGTNEPSGQMYALFIPEQVLGVQAQIKAALTDGDVTDDDKVTSLRFVTSVDSLNYREVGFYVTYKIGEQEYTSKSASKKVYEELYYVDSTEGKMSVKPQELFCNLSTYFKAGTVLNLPESFYEMEFTVQPFWVTMEGDIVKGDAVVKSVDMGCIKEEVYVSSSTDAEGNPIAADKSYYGSEEHPYASLDYAIAHVENKGTVRVKDSLTVASDATWTAHNKTITITGDDDSESAETLDFSKLNPAQLHVADNVTFSGLDIQFPTYVFGNGYRLIVAEDVNFIDVSKTVKIYGGGYKNHVKGTHLELYAGTYAEIFGGAHEANVNGDITVVVGGNVNPKATGTDHTARNYMLFGASRRGTVNGDISLTVQEGAKFDYVYGGGGSLSSGSVVNVKGDINVEFAGKTYSLYGGGRYGTNADTHVKVVGGEVYQLFGGCEHKSMIGNTSVEVLGGNVLRRLYGGCYNDYDAGKWATTNHVTGTTSVTIGTNISLNKESDNALCAISRCESKFEDENGVLIFQNDLYSSLSGKVQNLWGSHAYNYLVKASAGGDVFMAKDGLSIEPADGKNAAVRLDSASGEVEYFAGKKGTYSLPELKDSKREIYITFEKAIFGSPSSSTNTSWDVTEQYQSEEILANGASKVTGTIYATENKKNSNGDALPFANEYTDMDLTLTVKDVPDVTGGEANPGTTVTYDFNGYIYQIRTVYYPTDEAVVFRVLQGMGSKTNIYEFTAEQEAKFKSNEGVDVRMVRYGTDMYLYVDGTYVHRVDLAQLSSNVVTKDSSMSVSVRRYGETETPVAIPFIVIDKVTGSKVNVKSATNETVKTDDGIYEVGETATVTVTPNSGYYCNSLTVKKDGAAVTLNKALNMTDKNYTFVVEDGTYTVEATFVKRVFATPSSTANTEYDLFRQNESMEILANGGTRITGTVLAKSKVKTSSSNELISSAKYTDVDFTMTVKEGQNKDASTENPGTMAVFNIETGTTTDYKLHIRTVERSENGVDVVVLRITSGGKSGNTNIYQFTEEQTNKYKGDGVDVRFVRQGRYLYVFVDGQQCYADGQAVVLDLVDQSKDTIAEDAKLKVGIRRYGNYGNWIDIPYILIDKVTPSTITVEETEDGTVEVDKASCFMNEKVQITVKPESTSYYCRELTVTDNNGKVVSLLTDSTIIDSETTFDYTVGEGNYTVNAVFVKKVFTTPTESKTKWELLEQNMITEELANGGVRTSGVLYATSKAETGQDTLSFSNTKFKDIDLTLTVKDDSSVKSTTSTHPETIITIDCGVSGKAFQIGVTRIGEDVVIRGKSGVITTRLYKFSDKQEENYDSAVGAKLRVVKQGTKVVLYVDGQECVIGKAAHGNSSNYFDGTYIDLNELSGGSITTAKTAKVNIRRNGDPGARIAMPYSIANAVAPATVEAKKENTLVATGNAPSNTQSLDLDSNETYNVKVTNSGMTTDAYYKITYVDHVTNETQSVYTPAVAAGGSFEFTYQNGVFDAETESGIATILWENRIKSTKDALKVEVLKDAPEGEIIEANAVLGRAPMSKPDSTYPATNCNQGAISTTGEIVEKANYVYSDPIVVEKAGTKITFTDTVKADSHAGSDVLVISSWTEDANGGYVFDSNGTNIPGQYKPEKAMTFRYMTAEEAAEQGYDTFIERYKSGKIEYMYITSKPNEVIRLCYCAEEGTTSFPKIVQTYSGETGTAVEIALAEATDTWLEAQKAGDTYATYNALFAGKKISVIGDSYMQGSTIFTDGDTNDLWISMFANKYGMTLENHGKNGSTVSNFAGSTYNPMVDRWETDFANDTPDIIIVEGGRNDWNYNSPMGEIGTTDKGTFKGAATYLISSLKEKYPNAIIIGLTSWEVGGSRNAAGYYCSDYGRALIEVCESLDIPYIDAMQSADINVYMTSSNFMGRFCLKYNDVSHLNEKGMKLVLPIFEEKIYNICK